LAHFKILESKLLHLLSFRIELASIIVDIGEHRIGYSSLSEKEGSLADVLKQK